MIENRIVQAVGRVILLGILVSIFVFMLVWALNPAEEGGITARPPVPTTEDEGEGEGEDEGEEPPADEDPEPEPEPEPEPTPEGPTPEELEALIEAGADPAQTSVQVLDAGGGPTRTLSVTDALEGMGYQVVNVTSSRTDVAVTTVWFTVGNEPEGLALRARDDRFAEVAANERLSEGVNLHVLVGPDWQ